MHNAALSMAGANTGGDLWLCPRIRIWLHARLLESRLLGPLAL